MPKFVAQKWVRPAPGRDRKSIFSEKNWKSGEIDFKIL